MPEAQWFTHLTRLQYCLIKVIITEQLVERTVQLFGSFACASSNGATSPRARSGDHRDKGNPPYVYAIVSMQNQQ